MQAIIQDKYGSAEVLEARDIDKPAIGDDEVLVRVHAASIHVGDWILMTGSPFVMRMATGLRKPKNPRPGNRCRGDGRGGRHATSSGFGRATRCSAGAPAPSPSTRRAREDQLVKKPANLTFEQAAAVGVSATTALQLLRDDGKVQPGQKVLINGASGGVGHVRRADRQGVRRRGDRRVQHEERGPGPLDRRRPRHRLHPATTSRSRRRALRPHPRQRRQPLDGPDPARADPDRDADLERRRARGRQARPRSIRAMLASMFVRQQARPVGQDPEPRRPGRPEGARRSRQGHAGHRRHLPARARRPRPSATSRPATPAGRSSSWFQARHVPPTPHPTR